MIFFIYEDLKNATEVKIHLENCGFVDREPTETTLWHKCESIAEAENKAGEISKKYNKGWRRAQCCFRK